MTGELMNVCLIPRRVIRKVSTCAFELVGWDRVSRTRVRRRNDLRHIGTKYGGWVVPSGILNSRSICYCAGCGEDISFDLGLIDEFACHVFAFDPTPRAIEYVRQTAGQNRNYHFYDVGLWDKDEKLRFYAPRDPSHVSHSLLNLQKTADYVEVNVRRLAHIMREHRHERIDLLKIDIEGAEYKVLDSIIQDGIDARVICVEFDECFHPLDGNYKVRIRDSVRSLLANDYVMVCSQGNGNYTFLKDA